VHGGELLSGFMLLLLLLQPSDVGHLPSANVHQARSVYILIIASPLVKSLIYFIVLSAGALCVRY